MSDRTSTGAAVAVDKSDVIERQIFIKASLDVVWNLVSHTGFWVGETLQFGHKAVEGEKVQMDSTKWGVFEVKVERLDPPRFAAYRWASGFPGQPLSETNTTLVEFTLTPELNGVTVQVRESGFASLDGSDDFRISQYNGNADGWKAQLDLLLTAAEQGTR